ncbi:MAG: erythromycin esterase family protein [Bacillota bacterium]|nr:erythromycin esterase family protein [Bacillota bacterium]
MNDYLIQAIRQHSEPLRNFYDLEPLIQQINQQKYVLLGESSHGTSEYYKIRTEISKRLITEKGYTFIAVEGDWPACQEVNRYIKGFDQEHTNARQVLTTFDRWPTWMWANEEMVDFIEWLRTYNQTQPSRAQIGFYGLDVYSLWESMDEILSYLKQVNSPDFSTAQKAFTCFEPFKREPARYGVSASFYSEGCQEEVLKLLTELSANKNKYVHSEESSLNLEVNTLITTNAENYYRTMVINGNESWNIRDRHMADVLNKISTYYGDSAKGIVWEHNTHVGDARATDMVREEIVNVGEILREQEGQETIYIVGFGTHRGTVIAAKAWGINFERMMAPAANEGSWEDLMHKAGAYDKLIIFNEANRDEFKTQIGHRAIGVVYNPRHEHYENYVPSILSDRYDAFIYVNSSNALHPLIIERVLM